MNPRNVVIAAVTVVLGFGVNAVSHLAMLFRGSQLTREHRGTLQFVSAWLGDGLLLPVMNVAGSMLLRQTGGRPTGRETAIAIGAGGAVTAAMHVVQAAQGLVNWTMPQPWRWNLLGYYHLTFMWGQLAWLCVFLARGVRQWSTLGSSGRWCLATILAGLLAFAVVLRWDYREPSSVKAVL